MYGSVAAGAGSQYAPSALTGRGLPALNFTVS
jgi:hypothetical protein